MKLLCSILILSAVFSLNDASMSFEDQMLLAHDQMMLEDLERISADRTVNSIECSQNLLENLKEILDTYNNALLACNTTKEEELEAINANARKTIELFSNKIQNNCVTLSACSSMETVLASLDCYEEESSESAKVSTNIANDASTELVGMRAKIEACNGNEKICSTEAFNVYSSASMKYNSEFTDCVNGKQSGSGGDGEKPSDGTTTTTTTTTTESPEESISSPSGEDEGQAENGGRRPKLANKYIRL